MHKTFKYRIYPTSAQETTMLKTLDQCRWLYNFLLEQRRDLYNKEKKALSLYTQRNQFKTLRKEKTELKAVHSHVLYDVSTRVDLAFKAFFRRVKRHENPGYPRFKGRIGYNSFTYTQNSWKIENNAVRLSKIGVIKAVIHRPIEGIIKTTTVIKSTTGKWYVNFVCEIKNPKPLKKSKKQIGIDVGLETFAYFSDKTKIENPRFFVKEQKQLAQAQKSLSNRTKGSIERRKKRKIVARIHERIKFKRDNFSHQESRKIVNKYGIIAIEDLNVNRMLHDKLCSKNIADAAWSEFANKLSHKAEWAGRKFVAVNPAYTSQDCSKCGHRQLMPLKKREFACPCCHLKINRDLNASLNILSRGLATLGIKPVEAS